MSDEPRSPANHLREVDDAIAEDTVILREIEQEFQELEVGDEGRPALSESGRGVAQELRDEAVTASDLSREVASADE